MDWLERLNTAMNYIEDHLSAQIDVSHAAALMQCSTYQFTRMFGFISDVTLSEYIRRRRLTLAAFDLQGTDTKIIDIALTYGYDSPTAFSRAFQNQHGISPSAARDKGVSLKAYPRIIFHISIKGDVEMNYKIEEKHAFTVVGIKRNVSTIDGINFKLIPQFWDEVTRNGLCERVAKLFAAEPWGSLGVCADMYDDDKTFDYWIAATSSAEPPEGMEKLLVPACTWAIFEATGAMPGAIQETFQRIYGEWFPTSGYEHASAPEIEVYSDGDMQSPDYKSWVWIPVVKKG